MIGAIQLVVLVWLCSFLGERKGEKGGRSDEVEKVYYLRAEKETPTGPFWAVSSQRNGH